MGFLSLYMDVLDKNVFILGVGEVATRRARSFIEKGANVRLVGDKISSELSNMGCVLKPLDEIDSCVDWSDIVIIASDNKDLVDYVVSISENKLINRADSPFEGNLIVPNSFFIGDVEVSLSTHGKSPLMAKQLRKKIQETITENDIKSIQLQDYCRKLLKSEVPNQKTRKKILYNILNNSDINNLINNGEFEEAKKQANKLIKNEIKEL